ncbi:MAG: helix-turn-helix transcriptional regulator [Chitinophagaceae bacterium]|nr:helix-turn-helix transcriptional regulator [Chitinophagaceae bacterium]
MEKKIHQGKNITRFRQMLGIKQDALAADMGDDWTQIKISRLEAKEEIEPAILEEVAKALKVPVQAIENFDEEAAISIVANTIHNHDQAAVISYQPTFNLVDKIVEILERTIKEKDEEIARLRGELGR